VAHDLCHICLFHSMLSRCMQNALYLYCIGLFLAPAIQSLCENTYM
jgi:hypothetical protein